MLFGAAHLIQYLLFYKNEIDEITTMKVPRHVAIIMDGNGRWAVANGWPRTVGHRAGANAAERVIDVCNKLGVKYLTLFVFSNENWNRSDNEVKNLMELLVNYLHKDIRKVIENNIKVFFIGDRIRLGTEIMNLMQKAEEESAISDGMVLTLAINYGGRNCIRAAARDMALYCAKNSFTESDLQSLDEGFFDRFVCSYRHNIPDTDLLIRTGGEYRISNFLLWESAYAELYFSQKLWPDFGEADILLAFEAFSVRERRFGKEVSQNH